MFEQWWEKNGVHALRIGYLEQIIQIQPLFGLRCLDFYLEQILSETLAPPSKNRSLCHYAVHG